MGRGIAGVLVVMASAVVQVFAQPFAREVYSIPTTASGSPVEHPFTGGYYNPSHQFLDLDGDGDADLFLYDFNDNSFQFYRNVGTPTAPRFRLQPAPFVLPALNGWFKFADFNGDGVIDLFTGGEANNVRMYRNTGTNPAPVFTLFTADLRDSANNAVFTQVQCIPVVADIDNDGDPDFFSLNPGNGTINYYENIGSATQFRLAFRTDFWQRIQICPGCFGANTPDNPMHGQGTLYFGDIDGDRTLDMLYGDLFDPGLCYYHNTGTVNQPVMDSITCRFPVNDPILTPGFNQPSLIDIDGDRDLDMFVSVLGPLRQVDNFYLYRNTGDSVNYHYAEATRSFLPTLDFGIESVPALVDIDNDGDDDLFVGDGFSDGSSGRIAFLRNTGTATHPAFDFVDSSFVGGLGYANLAPRFADIDGDGDYDLFVGRFGGNIAFFRNIGTPTVPNFQRVISQCDSLNAGSQTYVVPAFFDYDNDGLLDLFIGKPSGTIAYYRNVGTGGAPRFSLITQTFLNIAVGNFSNPRVTFADADGDGDQDMIIGTDAGGVLLYRNDGPVGNPAFTLIPGFFSFLEPTNATNVAASDIDNDGDADLFVGGRRGGLDFYRNSLLSSSTGEVQPHVPLTSRLFQNYPNPFNPATTIGFRVVTRGHVAIRVYDLLGREVAMVLDREMNSGTYLVEFDASKLAAGMYFYRLITQSTIDTKRMLLLK
jgi:hypothetical protein